MYELRDYQQECADAILDFFQFGKIKDRPIAVQPTGAGKSIVIAYVASTLKEGVLVLQPSKELLEQNFAKYESYGGRASIYSASMGQKNIGDVTFATIGSIRKSPELFAHVKYIIIDECHLVPPNAQSMFMTFLNAMEDVKVVGLTATAFRLKKYNDPFTGEPYSQINLLMREKPRFFNRFLHITQIKELYDKKYLAPVKYIPIAWSNGELRYNSTGAEYTEKSMDFALKQQKIHERLPGIILQARRKGRKYMIVFVKNVSDAAELASRVPGSAFVCAETKKKDRAQILDDFKAGKIKTVFNVGILTIGFDFPELDTIIIARPTMSLALFMQMIGRGIRQHPDKFDCALVDMCGNIPRFSQLEDIYYTTDFEGKWILHDGTKQLSGVKLSSIT
jgi:DNA repair protein RadD